jgi:hypothetical protein
VVAEDDNESRLHAVDASHFFIVDTSNSEPKELPFLFSPLSPYNLLLTLLTQAQQQQLSATIVSPSIARAGLIARSILGLRCLPYLLTRLPVICYIGLASLTSPQCSGRSFV